MRYIVHYSTICWFICYLCLPLSAQGAVDAPDPGQRYGPVQENETLWRVATHLRPAGVTTAQMAIALQQANPRAFANGDIHQLLAGAVLQIPALRDIRRIGPTEATARLQIPPDPVPSPVVPPDPILDHALSVAMPASPMPTDQTVSAFWMFWIGSGAIVGCILLLSGLILWRRRTREQAYPAALAASATLTPIPVPARAQPAWLAPPGPEAIPIAQPSAQDIPALERPKAPVEEPTRVTGIVVSAT